MTLKELKQKDLAPEWMTDSAFETLSRGYLLEGETPRDAVKRLADTASSNLNYHVPSGVFFEAIWNNWLCPASPIWSNFGTERGLPISCNSLHIKDSVSGIFTKNHELAMLSKNGAGVGIYLGDVRGRGATIKGNGKSEGIIPWIKVLETTTLAVSQGGTRKGASACYLPITHSDYEEFLQIRRSTGDHNRRARNMNIAACIDDNFMNEMLSGNKHNQKLWLETLKERVENGEPYMFFNDNVERQKPQAYKNNNLVIKTSNICNEIYLYTDPEHTLVCCLSSTNVDKFDEWYKYKFSNGMSLPEVAAYFLESVLNEYIVKTENLEGFAAARNSAIKGRAIGIGVLGWHSYLQSKNIEMDSFDSMMANAKVFKYIDDESKKASADMAKLFGEPEWCVGTGYRHTHRVAVAPTATNSIISGGVSAGIEPINSNCYSLKSAKGTFIVKNRDLEILLDKKGLNTTEIWNKIIAANGSVLGLKELSPEEKAVFLTAREINQHTLIKLASQRQKFIDQGQSLNLFMTANASAKYIHEVHLEAWKQGLKGLYYLRSETVLNGTSGSEYRSAEECKACEG